MMFKKTIVGMRNKIIYTTLLIVGILLMTIGITYAFFNSNQLGVKNSVIISGDIYLVYNEGLDTIDIRNAFPSTYSEGISQSDGFTFTVRGKNTYDSPVYYDIIATTGSNRTGLRMEPSLINLYMTKTYDGTTTTIIDGVSYDNWNNRVIYRDMIPANSANEIVHTYNLKVWVDNDVLISDTDPEANYTSGEYNRTYQTLRINVKSGLTPSNVYGVRRLLSTSSTAWERLENSVGKTATATINGVVGTNDFDNIYPWSEIKSYNYDPESETITAWIGDDNFKFDGTNGEVLTYIPEFYYRRYQDENYEYVYISDHSLNGYVRSEAFSVGRYKMSEEDNIGHSKSGKNVSTNKSIVSHRTIARELGNGFEQMDWHYFILQMLYLVEYANNHSQTKLGQGIANLSYNASIVALKTENATNRIIIDTEYADSFIVGQQIDVGTSLGGRQIATYRTIAAINNYDDGTITGIEVMFDGDPVNIVTGNRLYSCGQKSGDGDTLGMLSGCINNDGKHGVIYRGIEDIFGNVFEWVDGINIKDYKAFINYNHLTYRSDKFDGDYVELGYYNANTNGTITTLGYDTNNPLIAFPTSIGGSSSTYMSDYYYRATGNRVVCVGGLYDSGSNAGLWYWFCFGTSSTSDLYRGARLLRYHS